MISAAGRTLHDLNYVDLFGEDYAECVELRIRCLWPARPDSGSRPGRRAAVVRSLSSSCSMRSAVGGFAAVGATGDQA